MFDFHVCIRGRCVRCTNRHVDVSEEEREPEREKEREADRLAGRNARICWS